MKKGFTLVELMAVIIILSVLTLVIVPPVVKQINEAKTSEETNQKEMVIEAAKNWGQDNYGKTSVTWDQLIEDGYMDEPKDTNASLWLNNHNQSINLSWSGTGKKVITAHYTWK